MTVSSTTRRGLACEGGSRTWDRAPSRPKVIATISVYKGNCLEDLHRFHIVAVSTLEYVDQPAP